MAGRRYVILGDGAAGMTAAGALRRLDPAGSITVVADDPHPTYFRAALTNYLLGELREDQIWAVPPTFYRDLDAARVFARAVAVDPQSATVALASGDRVPYESLLVATGARPRPAPFEGADLPGVIALRTLQDARAVMDLVLGKAGRRAVVLGGGPLGLEWAHALRERGAAVTLIARGERLVPEALDATASDLVLARLRRGGIDVRMGEEIAAAVAGPDGHVAEVRTKGGEAIACDLCAVAVGVVCNTEVLRGSGVALGPRGGVIVDDRMRTSVENVYAAGDVAEHEGRLLQLWEPARRMAEVAAATMAGVDRRHAPGAHYFATRLYDLDFAAVGTLDAAPGDKEIVDWPRATGRIAYRRLVVREGRLIGALMVGEREAGVRKRGRLYKKLVDLGADVSAITGELLDPTFDLHGWIETRSIVARPPPPPPGGLRPADVRGTQRLVLPLFAGATVQAAPPGAEARTVAVAADTRTVASPMLSIGLRSPLSAAAPAEAAIAPARLEGAGRVWPLDREIASIGRHAAADVVLDDASVSSRHAEIVVHEGARYLRDSGSRNGTWVGGALVTVPHRLADGDRIRVGATELTFRSEGTAPFGVPVVTPTLPDTTWGPVLEVERGAGLGLAFALRGPQVTVGRDPACGVRLDDLSVSRRHAVLAESGGRWTVSDLASSRGTTKNDARLAPGEDVPLEEGDVLAFGDVVARFARRARPGD
jgi:NADPH-dependent 2,4-dienoyl-CoA reductase/sulfur reductase-like enzyme/pSer/pThr/pTyr-binding forkhead associated (FHA) protein